MSDKSLEIRVLEWSHSRDAGLSSMAIAFQMVGLAMYDHHPLDPHDLGRCLRMLHLFPQFRERLDVMKTVSLEWQYLVERWDTLAELYSEWLATNGESKACYFLMRQLRDKAMYVRQKMKALTLWEPWASLMADGHKQYETRSWSTEHRGQVLIHSGKRWTQDQRDFLFTIGNRFDELQDYDRRLMSPGCIVGIGTLVNVHRVEDVRDRLSEKERALGDYSDGRIAWEFRHLRSVYPVPAKGKQRLWTYRGA